MENSNKKSWLEKNIKLVVLVYLGFIAIYTLFPLFTDTENPSLSFNELGDFLAGTFAPLAFLFLYLGYIQQGRELKQNTEALTLQAKELANSVEQQKNLVKTTQQELNLLIEQSKMENKSRLINAQPFFHVIDTTYKPINATPSTISALEIIIKIENSRAIARNFSWEIYFCGRGSIQPQDLNQNAKIISSPSSLIYTFKTNTIEKIRLNINNAYLNMNHQNCYMLKLGYIDELENLQSVYIAITIEYHAPSQDFYFSTQHNPLTKNSYTS